MAGASDLFKMLMAGGEDALKYMYKLKSDQMALPVPKRIQPDPNRMRILDQDYRTPAPITFSEDLGASYPRNPNPLAPLPKGDRARPLIEKRKIIADKLTEKITGSGILDSDARYFYNSDGPTYRAAVNAGLTPDQAEKFLNDYSKFFAATSPRTPVEPNVLNTSSVMAKIEAGIPHRKVIGGGTIDEKTGKVGISERGYPMMTGKGGIHGNLIDDVIQYGAIDRATNTKPATFGANMTGNRSGATVDTHAIRGALIAMNDAELGSVPEGFILPKFRDAYKKDPSVLTPNMIDDTIGKQIIEVDGRKVNAQTEYPVIADIYHEVGKNLQTTPAEAQALGWFGLGDETNLASAKKTVSDVIDERINVTAQATGLSPEEVAQLYFRRKIPLLQITGAIGAGAGGVGMLSPNQSQAATERDILNYFASVK